MNDPFVTGHSGGSQKMATFQFETSIGDITVRANPRKRETSSSAPEIKLSSERPRETPPLHGVSHATVETGRRASNAASSETKASTYRRSLSDRLTLSLISAGLVCGITPSLTRKQSGQPIQVLALDTPGGIDAASAGKVLSSLSALEASDDKA